MLTSANIVFYVVFLGQIFLISYYFPKQILARMEYVTKTYPPSQYPRLYPQSTEYYTIGRWAFKLASRIIVGLGLLILFTIIFVVDHSTFADDGYISEAWPVAYGMIQFLPLVALEFSEVGQFKLMREARAETTRTADLRRRGLFDFVSPKLFGFALAAFFGAILVDLYAHDFNVSWGHDTIQRTLIFTLYNLFIAGIGAWNIYGKKLNPHQSADDRARQIKTTLHAFIYVSLAMNLFWITQAADDVFDIDYLDAIIMSVYFQVIVLLSLGTVLRNMKLEDINFEVYKNSPAA
jgi:hypothetical protein